jgi:hypothetical protein
MSATPKTLYDTDFAEWSDRTAALIRAGQFHEIDAENVAEEIESLGKSERHQLRSRIVQILEHLLTLKLTSGPLREYNERGWRGSIRRQQGEIEQLVCDSPSLKDRLTREMLESCYRSAAGTVAIEYAVKPPVRCPFTWSEVLPAKANPAKSKKV